MSVRIDGVTFCGAFTEGSSGEQFGTHLYSKLAWDAQGSNVFLPDKVADPSSPDPSSQSNRPSRLVAEKEKKRNRKIKGTKTFFLRLKLGMQTTSDGAMIDAMDPNPSNPSFPSL